MFRSTWLRRISSLTVTATMAGFGFTGLASAQSISTTGQGSYNSINSTYTNNCSVTNTNKVSVDNSNRQTATSGNVTENGNTVVGSSWGGWAGMDPALAQSNGTGYGSWWSNVVSWIGQRAAGNNWASNQSNLSWTPSGSSWANYDPMTWQANGQSFGIWYNSVESYLNNNTPNWVLTWPLGANGSSNFGGASTGNASNNYNANFTININNAARAAAGTNSCGQSNFTPPPATGGMGGGGTWTAPVTTSTAQTNGAGGSGGYGGGSGSGGYYTGGTSGYSSPAAPSHISTASAPIVSQPVVNTPPTGGGMGGGAPVNTISTTGQGSHNTINNTYTDNSSVTNTNTICVTNTSTQTATSGNATQDGNTVTSGGGTGNASNGNGSGYEVGVNN